MSRQVRIFISYSHVDEPYRKRLEVHLAPLRREGLIEPWHDRMITAGADWAGEIDQNLAKADLVLLLVSADFIASEYCFAKEMKLTLERHEAGTARVIPIHVRPTDYECMPFSKLQMLPQDAKAVSTWSNEDEAWLGVAKGIRRAVRSLLEPPPTSAVEKTVQEPGIKAPRPTKSTKTRRDDDRFASSIRSCMAKLDRQVERLTREQLRVIALLREFKRVRIGGIAGSGKTLVAAEKAIRLAAAGLETLFLCHNPYLAEHVVELVGGSAVRVSSFCKWIGLLAEGPPPEGSAAWSNYDEPTTEMLVRAFDQVERRGPRYDAIVVDEGQDFRPEWWAVVEAALRSPDASVFFIFHDDRQSLLPHRGNYPATQGTIDLSRNCRNAGRIYGAMRCIEQGAPEGEDELRSLGDFHVCSFRRADDVAALRAVLPWFRQQDIARVVVLLGTGTEFESTPFASLRLQLNPQATWQAEVRRRLGGKLLQLDQRGVIFPPGGVEGIESALELLSEDEVPSARDVELVRGVARRFSVDASARALIASFTRRHWALHWRERGGAAMLRRTVKSPLSVAELVMHFEREDWHEGIRPTPPVTFRPHHSATMHESIPVYSVGDFKGLEADAVLAYFDRPPLLPAHEVFVAISRARVSAFLLIDQSTAALLPSAVFRYARELEARAASPA